jgi:M6 family metalloprotease-like protein
LFYDSLETKAGNPSAVNAIRDELQKRLLERSGDLYERHFAFSPDSFNVLAILYEGVGSGGTVDLGPADFIKQGSLPTFLLARNFLTEENYQDYGTSFFAHEFGHTLGLPDNYDTKTGKPYSDDLMGSGRYRPLEATYILDKDKNSLGFKL